MSTPRLPQRFLQIIEGLSILSLPQCISGPPELVAEVSLGPFGPVQSPLRLTPSCPRLSPPPPHPLWPGNSPASVTQQMSLSFPEDKAEDRGWGRGPPWCVSWD